MLTSDAAILFFSSVGLALTAVSIVRDTLAQRDAVRVMPDNVQQLVVEEAQAEAA